MDFGEDDFTRWQDEVGALPVPGGVGVATQAAIDALAGVYGRIVVGARVVTGLVLDGTSAAENTTVIVNAVAAAEHGDTLLLPSGVIALNPFTIDKAVTIRGVGWWCNYFGAPFGDAGWALPTVIGGTVLRFAATTGVCITWQIASVRQRRLEDVAIVGPGAGTSTGVLVGSGAVGVVGTRWANVLVSNFFTNINWKNCELSTTYQCYSLAAGSVGFLQETNCNQVVHVNFTAAGNATSHKLLGSTLIEFIGGSVQGGSGAGMRFELSYGCRVSSMYFENANGTFALDLETGGNNIFENVHLGIPAKDTVRVNCDGNRFRSFQQTCAITYTALAQGNLIEGAWSAGVTDGGTGNTWVDQTGDGLFWSGQAPYLGSGLILGTTGDVTITRNGASSMSLNSTLTLASNRAGIVDIISLGRKLYLYGGGSSNAAQIVSRGPLQVDGDNTGATLYSGSGAPARGGAVGDQYMRTDTPNTANQRTYICTVAHATAATWVGIV